MGMPSALASLERETTQPSFPESTTTDLVIPFDETTSTYLKGVLLAVREPAFLFRAVFQVRALDVPAVFLLDVAEQNRL